MWHRDNRLHAYIPHHSEPASLPLPNCGERPLDLSTGMKAAPPLGGKTLDICSLLCYTVFSSFARFKRNSVSVGSLA
jgi:hypothetical protein